MAEDLKKISKFLSLVLRHEPWRAGVELEPGGWVPVDSVLAAANVSRETLERVVAESDKQRFSIDESGTRIRANQGHSVEVDLRLEPKIPPDVLFHGTHPGAVEAIRVEGLKRMSRHAVHLSPDEATAERVGARRGKPVILRVDARAMAADGTTFYLSENGVWLTESVPPQFIEWP